MTIKEEVINMKKELKEAKKESFAYELLKEQQKQNKRLFIIWIITFVAFLGLLAYTIYLINDINVIEETSEYSQEITDFESINDSTITNGGK